MDNIQLVISLFAIIGSNIGLFLWSRSETRSDIRHMDAKLDVSRELIHAIHKETREMINAIHQEVKDFHGHLADLKEKNKNKGK